MYVLLVCTPEMCVFYVKLYDSRHMDCLWSVAGNINNIENKCLAVDLILGLFFRLFTTHIVWHTFSNGAHKTVYIFGLKGVVLLQSGTLSREIKNGDKPSQDGHI